MNDLITTWEHARAGLQWPDFARLMKDGVTSNITGKMPSNGGLAIGADDIAVKDGRWERRFRGDRAIILPVWGRCPDDEREPTMFEIEAQHRIDTLENCQETVTRALGTATKDETRTMCGRVLNGLAAKLDKEIARANEIYRKASMEVIDLVAFRPDTPRSFWSYTGAGMMLGADALDRAQHYSEPLAVHESPLDWLRAGCDGIVILDWKHYWPAYLGGLPALHASNVEFGRALSAKLSAPLQLPQILVAA